MSLILVSTEWTSSRPLPDPAPTPNDINPEGKLTFNAYDPLAGAVQGMFHHTASAKDFPFEGFVTFNGGSSYLFVIHHTHPTSPAFTQLYEGELLVNSDLIALVAGSFTTIKLDNKKRVRLSKEELALLAIQDEGAWVATKP